MATAKPISLNNPQEFGYEDESRTTASVRWKALVRNKFERIFVCILYSFQEISIYSSIIDDSFFKEVSIMKVIIYLISIIKYVVKMFSKDCKMIFLTPLDYILILIAALAATRDLFSILMLQFAPEL